MLRRSATSGCSQPTSSWTVVWVLTFVPLLLLKGGLVGEARGMGQGASPAAPDSFDAGPEIPIREARRDRDDDFVPDRKGDTVAVRGRVSGGIGMLPDPRLVFIQDETAGIAVRLPRTSTVRRGDSLRVTGVVQHQYGLTRLRALTHDRPGAMSRNPEPTPLTVSAAQPETYEGQLVQIHGRVVANRSNDGGRYLLIEDRIPDAKTRIAVFVPSRRQSEIPLDDYESGDRITVTGILSQHDYAAPYDSYYQVLPRDHEDLSESGFATPYLQTVIILFVAGALLAIIVVFTLRAAVNRRTEQLAESRSRFQRLAEATFEGIIIHENGEILDVNRSLTQMIGYDRDELVGEPFRSILSGSMQDADRTVGHARPGEAYEAVVVREDGSTFPAEVEEKAVDTQDREVRVVAIRNVTERKKWEREILRAKEEAEEMAQLKSSLLNNMSHELRTPITSIIGYAELILNEPDAAHDEFAARIRESGRRLSRTLRSVLEMAQIESGTLDVEPTDVDIRLLVREVVENHRRMAEQEQLELRMDAQDSLGSFPTDRALARRILGNLVHNAIKFTEEGQVRVQADTVESGVRIVVSDTGIGMGADFREHLFEPFKQESEGRARTHEGTGLGLALTKRMVDLLRGQIEVETAKGDGTTVVVRLPPMASAGAPDQATIGAEAA